jgi:colicin import membrane protein
MNLKALFAAVALSLLASVAIAADDKKPEAEKAAAEAKPADAAAKPAEAKKEDKAVLNADADAEVKAAIEAAEAANSAAKKAGFEWFWKDKPASAHLEDAIKAANEGKKEDALKLAKAIETAGKQGQEQAEAAKKVAPRI